MMIGYFGASFQSFQSKLKKTAQAWAKLAAQAKAVAKPAVTKKLASTGIAPTVATIKNVINAQKAAAVAGMPSGKIAAVQLQADLVVLGKMVKDKTLAAVKADGIIGAKTATAVYRAFSKYVKGAPTALRKKMTAAKIRQPAILRALTVHLQAEIKRRGGAPANAGAVVATQALSIVKPKAAVAKKAAVKKTKLLVKSSKAKVKYAGAKVKAAKARKAAAKLRARAATKRATNPAAAAADEAIATKLDTQAAAAESTAQDLLQEARAASAGAAEAAAEEKTATREATGALIKHAAAAGGPAAAVAAAAAAQETAARSANTEAAAGLPAPAVEAAAESFFSKYKAPIIGVSALTVLGIAALMLRKPSPTLWPRKT